MGLWLRVQSTDPPGHGFMVVCFSDCGFVVACFTLVSHCVMVSVWYTSVTGFVVACVTLKTHLCHGFTVV